MEKGSLPQNLAMAMLGGAMVWEQTAGPQQRLESFNLRFSCWAFFPFQQQGILLPIPSQAL